MKPMISNAQAPLLRAVQHLLIAALAYEPARPVSVFVESAVSEDWASATFVGQRHRIEVRLDPGFDQSSSTDGTATDAGRDAADGAVADAALMTAVTQIAATIGEAEIDVTGHFVAEIAVVSFEPRHGGAVQLTFEALTLLD
jgi:hypothetical protein